VAEEKRRERALAEGADMFRQVTSDPETAAAFGTEYGAPAPDQTAPRAA